MCPSSWFQSTIEPNSGTWQFPNPDPGTVNWISTQGYANGQILIRTLLADPLMEATFKVIKAVDIPERDKRGA